jgi:flagellar biosynthesis regulator FlbT
MTLASAMFGYLMLEMTVKFLEEKIVLQLSSEEVPIRNIPFPAVTICPEVVLDENFHSFDRKLYSPSDEK